MSRYTLSLSRRRTPLTSGSFVIAATALASGAWAQCDVYRPGLPDFDQRRQAAPGILGLPDNGAVHCVPTSAADAIAYAANHGAPGLMFNNMYDWDSPTTYNIATDLIDDLGTLMGTGGTGTNGTGYVNGMTAFLNARAPGQFAVSTIGWANGFGPSPQRVHNIIAQGGFTLIVRGTYAPEENNPAVLHRIGGHILLARNVYDACSASPNIGMRDPNSSDSRFVNSPWGVYREDMNAFNATFRLSNGTTQPRNYWEWSNDYGVNRKVMDGLFTFIPTFALGGAVVNGEEAGVNIIRPMTLTGPVQPPHVETFLLPPELGTLSSLELTPDFGAIVIFSRTAAGSGGGGGAGKVSMRDISLNATVHHVLDLASPVVDTCTSPAGHIYACEAHQISRLVRTPDGSFETSLTITVQDTLLACAFDDAADELVIITGNPGGAAHVKVFDGTTLAQVRDVPCPSQVALRGAVGLCIDPADGDLFCCGEDLPVVYRLSRGTSGVPVFSEAIALPPGTEPCNPHINDAGALLFTSNGAVHQIEHSDLGLWQENYGATFSGYEFGRSFSLATSRDGIAHTEQTGPDTTNISDEPLSSRADCPADFNDDGAVTSQDFFDFLTAFFSDSPRADVNGNDTLNSQDFFDFLAAFFAGC